MARASRPPSPSELRTVALGCLTDYQINDRKYARYLRVVAMYDAADEPIPSHLSYQILCCVRDNAHYLSRLRTFSAHLPHDLQSEVPAPAALVLTA